MILSKEKKQTSDIGNNIKEYQLLCTPDGNQ